MIKELIEGDKAPEFKGVNQDGKEVSSNDFVGKKVILYFYPKDNTPGCTAEACDLNDNFDFWANQGYEIVGVSPDSEASHQRFIAKHGLKFQLISDPEKEILEAFNAWGLKKLYGKEYMGVLRKTFVINEDGIITNIFKKVKTKTHTDQIKTELNIEA